MGDQKGGGSGRTGRGRGTTKTLNFANQEDAARYGNNISASWEASLTPDEESALSYYKEGSATLNSSLRDGTYMPKNAKAALTGLDSALARAVLPDTIQVFRGVGDDVVSRLSQGQSVWDKGFLSTTGDRRIAEHYVSLNGRTGYIVRIQVPAGSHGMYIDSNPKKTREFSNETEFLFARNSRLRIHRINEADRTIEAMLEQ